MIWFRVVISCDVVIFFWLFVRNKLIINMVLTKTTCHNQGLDCPAFTKIWKHYSTCVNFTIERLRIYILALWISYLYHFASYHPIFFFLSCLAPQSIFPPIRNAWSRIPKDLCPTPLSWGGFSSSGPFLRWRQTWICPTGRYSGPGLGSQQQSEPWQWRKQKLKRIKSYSTYNLS